VDLLIPSFEVGLAQINIKHGDVDQNLTKAIDVINSNSELDIIIFPELFLTGFDLDRKEDLALQVTRASEIEKLSRAAAKNKTVLFGSVLAQWDKQYANTLFVIDRDGTLVSVYNKAHLFALMNEHKHFRPGNTLEVVTLSPKGVSNECVSFGLATCYDLRFPEMFRQLRVMGAEFFVIPAEWPKPRIDHWVALTRARAIENQCYVLGVNRVGTDPDNYFNGKSLAIKPTGEILTLLEETETIGVVHIESYDLEKYRVTFPVMRDRRPELYGL